MIYLLIKHQTSTQQFTVIIEDIFENIYHNIKIIIYFPYLKKKIFTKRIDKKCIA